MSITVEEIKAKIPEAEVYALGRNTSHVIVYNRDLCDRELVYGISRMLHQDDVHVIIVGVSGKPGDAIRLLQVKPEIELSIKPSPSILEQCEQRMKDEIEKSNRRLTHVMFFHSGSKSDMVCKEPGCSYREDIGRTAQKEQH